MHSDPGSCPLRGGWSRRYTPMGAAPPHRTSRGNPSRRGIPSSEFPRTYQIAGYRTEDHRRLVIPYQSLGRALTSCTGICIYKQPFVILACSNVLTPETLAKKLNAADGVSAAREATHYARRCCSSVIAGTFRAFEKGFQRLMNSQTPDTESPKFRGELSSIYNGHVRMRCCGSLPLS